MLPPALLLCILCRRVTRMNSIVHIRANENVRRPRRGLSSAPFTLLLSRAQCLPDCLLDVLGCRQLLRAGLLLWPAPARRGSRPCKTRGGGLASIRNACYGAEGPDPPGNVGLLHQHSGAGGGSFDEHKVRLALFELLLSRRFCNLYTVCAGQCVSPH